MKKIVDRYIFRGFGFDVIIPNVEIKETKSGQTYPVINMDSLKCDTTKALVRTQERLTGKKLKFLRTFLGLSYRDLAKITGVGHTTLKNWENRGDAVTSLTTVQERHFRLHAIKAIILSEEKFLAENCVVQNEFRIDPEPQNTPLDLQKIQEYSFTDYAYI